MRKHSRKIVRNIDTVFAEHHIRMGNYTKRIRSVKNLHDIHKEMRIATHTCSDLSNAGRFKIYGYRLDII